MEQQQVKPVPPQQFPMISVDKAIAIILQQSIPLMTELVPIVLSCGRVTAIEIKAIYPFPTFRASIMDGYAVKVPIQINRSYSVQHLVLAGDIDKDDIALQLRQQQDLSNSSIKDDSNDKIIYITTGAKVPDGANAVMKIEDTEKDPLDSNLVKLKAEVAVGANIREIGSDIAVGDVLIDKGQMIDPADIGLLACAGVINVLCYRKPIVGIMSTGDELIEVHQTPVGSQIRDSNRATLLASFRDYETIDYGIVKDSVNELEKILRRAVQECDILITSGGVSMGAADHVKPLLGKLGTIHFGRLNMKPGKPTTFATVLSESGNHQTNTTINIESNNENIQTQNEKKCMVFGLPGNPVSCIVTKALLIDPCLKRLQGISISECLHPQITVTCNQPLTLDSERPEYHRACLSTVGKFPGSLPQVVSTGNNQRSSRLLSMKYSNVLLCLPQGVSTGLNGCGSGSSTGVKNSNNVNKSVNVLPAGTSISALIVGTLTAPVSTACYHQEVYSVIEAMNSSNSTTTTTTEAAVVSGTAGNKNESVDMVLSNTTSITPHRLHVRVGLLTISDRAYEGVYADLSGPEMHRLLDICSNETITATSAGTANTTTSDWHWSVKYTVVITAVVPDDIKLIQSKIIEWTKTVSTDGQTNNHTNDSNSGNDDGDDDILKLDLILTSGGTGFGQRDVTPEAIRPLLQREAPGVAQSLLNEGLKHTPLAVLSRPVVGTRGNTLICTLPGSVKAVKENFQALKLLLPRIIDLLQNNQSELLHK